MDIKKWLTVNEITAITTVPGIGDVIKITLNSFVKNKYAQKVIIELTKNDPKTE